MINTVLQLLEDTWLATEMRESSWLYPGIEILHIIGIVLLVGPAFMFDLRLLGFSKELAVASLAQHLLSWSERGLILVIPSGLLLFIANASTLGKDPVFYLKMVLLFVAILNAFLFRRFVFRSVSTWDANLTTPALAKMAALISIIIWIAIITCGRLLAY